jgi:transcriptional regulator with GAF, ATPase, and Fis domain
MTDEGNATTNQESIPRHERIVSALVELADTLVDQYDVIEFLGRLAEHCVTLVGTDEAGIMLADENGKLQAVASSSERARLLELYELQGRDGPCLDAFRTGSPSFSADLRLESERWPNFVEMARGIGFNAVFSWPLRLRREVIGAINLLRQEPGELTLHDRNVARALADVATIGLIQQRTISDSRTTAEQLQKALLSRVRLEQAKGIVAARREIDIDDAFNILRGAARARRQSLTELAEEVVRSRLDPDQF